MPFASLRHLLTEPPSAEAWRALLHHFDAYEPDTTLEVALEYAQTHLQTWPDNLRTVPHRWLTQPVGGHPALPICRSLNLLAFGSAELLLAASSPLDKLTTLKLPLEWNQPDLVDALLAWPAARHVENLELLILGPMRASDVTKESAYDIITHLAVKYNYSLDKVRSLDVWQQAERASPLSVKPLISILLPNLEHLNLGHGLQEGMEVLLEMPATGRLRTLQDYSHRTLFSADQLAATAYPDTLEVLRLPIRRDSLQGLLSRPWPRLHTLALWGHRLTSAGVQALATTESLPALRELDLFVGRKVTVEGRMALAAAPWLPQLTSLTLTGLQLELEHDFITALMAEPAPRRLKTLNLDRWPIGGLGLRKLALSAHPLTELEHLRLQECEINCFGLQALVAAQAFPRLETLDLTSNPIADDGALALASTTHLNRLRTLKLGGCPIQAPGLHALLASPLVEQLDTIELSLHPIELELGQHWLQEGDPTPLRERRSKFKHSNLFFMPDYVDDLGALQELTLDNHLSVLDRLLALSADSSKLQPEPFALTRWELLMAFFTLLPTSYITPELLAETLDRLNTPPQEDGAQESREAPLTWIMAPYGGHPALLLSNKLVLHYMMREENASVIRDVNTCLECRYLSNISTLSMPLVPGLDMDALAAHLGSLEQLHISLRKERDSESDDEIDYEFSHEDWVQIVNFIKSTSPRCLEVYGDDLGDLLTAEVQTWPPGQLPRLQSFNGSASLLNALLETKQSPGLAAAVDL